MEENGREEEETDTWPFRRKSSQTQPDDTDVGAYPVPVPGSGCDREAEEYNMRHARRGVALIFSHNKFDRMPSRSGTAKDLTNLSTQLKVLGFEVRPHEDVTCSELLETLAQTSKEDHASADCLMVVVMTHGDPGILHARDRVYHTQLLWDNFLGDKCPSLAGKPKLFFIQACRGDLLDSGVVVTETDGSMPYRIPAHADILIAYSTMEGHYSWRNPCKGSWFIQALCEELKINGRSRDLLTLLTFVCRRVAIDYQSFVPRNEEMDMKKQVPAITSMLTRLVYFREK